jgi:hypothetical protein
MARWVNDRGAGDVLWRPGATREDGATPEDRATREEGG